MNVLFLAPQPFFEVRGTPLAVLAMVRALSGLGHRVDLLTYPQGDPVDPLPGVTHRRSPRLPVGRVRAGPSAAKVLLDVPFMAEAAWLMAMRRYDVVHAVEEAAHLAAPLTRLLRLRLVADVDSSIPDQLRYSGFARRGPLLWAAEALERHALRSAAVVVTVCTSLTEGVRRRAPGARVFQIEDPPLVDPRSPPDVEGARRLRAALGLPEGPVVLYTGNLEPYQGVDLLVAAAARVPEASLVVVGGEPAEIDALRVRARGLGAATRVFFAGKRPPTDLPGLLSLAQVLVSPRIRGENTPFKLYTYLASGTPVVATRTRTHTQILDESLAFLVDASPEDLASGIRRALGDAEGAAARASRGRELVLREYSVESHAAKVARAYETVASTL